jgi:hypothetical protein
MGVFDFFKKNINPYQKKKNPYEDSQRYGAVIANKPILDRSKQYGYTPIPQKNQMSQMSNPSYGYTPRNNEPPKKLNYTPIPRSTQGTQNMQNVPTPEAPEMPKNDATQNYLNYLRESQNAKAPMAQAQIDNLASDVPNRVGGINQAANISYANFNDQIEGYQKRGENYGDLIKSNIELGREGADASKADIEKQYQGSEADLTKQKQMQDIKRRNMFASLGTLESGGFMGFTGQQTEADKQFMTDLQDFKDGKIRDINEVNRRQQEFENTSIYKLQDTLDQFNAQINNIYADISKNEVQRNNDINAVYQDVSDKVFKIQEGYSSSMDEYEKMRYEVGSKVGNNNQNLGNELKIKNDYDAELKAINYQDILGQYERSKDANINDSAGQFTIIYGFTKLLDPATGVKEGEFQNTANAQSLLQQANGYLQKIQSGLTIDPGVAQKYKNEIERVVQPTLNKGQEITSRYVNYASGYGLNTDLISTGLSQGGQNLGGDWEVVEVSNGSW